MKGTPSSNGFYNPNYGMAIKGDITIEDLKNETESLLSSVNNSISRPTKPTNVIVREHFERIDRSLLSCGLPSDKLQLTNPWRK